MRLFRHLLGVGILVSGLLPVAGGALAQDITQSLARSFPAPAWQQDGSSFLCAADSCGKGSLVALQSGKGNVEARIRSGELDENWLRQFTAGYVQDGQRSITGVEAKRNVWSGIESLSGSYRCTCDNEVQHVAFRVLGTEDSYLVLVSMARAPKAARQNMRKLETVMAKELRS